jgi:hypothetical protein
MRRNLIPCFFLVMAMALFSCQKDVNELNSASEIPAIPFPSSNECGTPVLKDLYDQGAIADRGDLQIGNNADNIVVWASASGAPGQPNQVKKIIAVYGSKEYVLNKMNETILWTPCMGPQNPDRVKISTPGLAQDSIHIPNSAFQADGCVWMAVYVTLTDNSGFEWCTYPTPYDDIIINQSVWKVLVKYCKQNCPPTDCGQLRSQTQGGWGAKPSGNNPGTYLHANFASAFPSGLTVGCATGYTVKYTNAAAITEFLPAGGEAGVLTANAVNPLDKSIKNVLIGQVTALSLSVGFDAWDVNFGAGGQSLGSMYIKSGVFKGKTVSQFLAIANDVLGGCSNAYSPKDVNEVASAINENYIDGKVNNGYLSCDPVQ